MNDDCCSKTKLILTHKVFAECRNLDEQQVHSGIVHRYKFHTNTLFTANLEYKGIWNIKVTEIHFIQIYDIYDSSRK